MSKSEDMRRLIDLANNNKIISESHSDKDDSPFKAFSSWDNISEAGMPSSVIKSKEKIRYATDEENKQRFAGKTLEELRSMAWRHGYGKNSKEYDKFYDGVTGVSVTEDSAWNLSEYEELDEDVGGNYLYHGTTVRGLKKILQSGYVNAARTPQSATNAQTKLPSVSMTRDWGYASGSNSADQVQGEIGRDAILVFDRVKIENNFKTLGTSQSKQTKGLAFSDPRDIRDANLAKSYDVDNDKKITSKDADELFRRQTMMYGSKLASREEIGQVLGKARQDYELAHKWGSEFEEAIVVPKGVLPIKGTLVGFWINPRSELMSDSEIVNHPLRLDMPRPNTFVKHKEEDGVTEEGITEDVAPLSIEQLATISDEALDNAYHYGRSSPGNTFGWQANLKSAEFAKKMIDKGVTDIEQISDAIHRGWNITAHAFVQNPNQFDDTEKLKASGKLEAKLEQRSKLMNINYAQLPEDEKEKDRVVARALLQALTGDDQVNEDLHKWFKEKWVRFGPNGKIRGDCARGDDDEGKPKCLPQSKAHSLGKKARASAASRKRRKDPNADRSGKAINVNTKKKKKKKSNESMTALFSQSHNDISEAELDEACWKGYHKEGNKEMFGKTVPNCVKNTNEEQEQHIDRCPHCGGEMVSEELMNEKQDACYHKVKSRYKVWPSAYASGALVQCRKKGAANWGNKSESIEEQYHRHMNSDDDNNRN